MESPCKNCERRTIECHYQCKEYDDFRRQQKKLADEIRQKNLEDYLFDVYEIKRNRKTKG